MALKAKRIAPEVGFMLVGYATKWEDMDNGMLSLWTRTHRSGQHTATRSTDCKECLLKFRREVLGHKV